MATAKLSRWKALRLGTPDRAWAVLLTTVEDADACRAAHEFGGLASIF